MREAGKLRKEALEHVVLSGQVSQKIELNRHKASTFKDEWAPEPGALLKTASLARRKPLIGDLQRLLSSF